MKLQQILEDIEFIEKWAEHECYKNVNNYMTKHDLPHAKIIHGTVTSENKRIGHAWILNGNKVIDPTLGKIIPKNDYYRILNAKEDKIYTDIEAMRMSLFTRNHGPWSNSENKKFLNR